MQTNPIRMNANEPRVSTAANGTECLDTASLLCQERLDGGEEDDGDDVGDTERMLASVLDESEKVAYVALFCHDVLLLPITRVPKVQRIGGGDGDRDADGADDVVPMSSLWC